ncbi:hypothetical protein [Sorangium sp. So ce513]|uniref:hypothetical protein n=1 Tax=Sorangium sp. So ce513 TaxID=3133315 RepID=UPI003F60DDCB
MAQLSAPLASSAWWLLRVDPWSPWHPMQARSSAAPAAPPGGAAPRGVAAEGEAPRGAAAEGAAPRGAAAEGTVPRGAVARGPAGASAAWHDAHVSPARAWGSDSGPGAACPPGGGNSSAAAPVATAPASAAGSRPRKRVTSEVDSARRAARPRTTSRGWAARWRGSDRSAR